MFKSKWRKRVMENTVSDPKPLKISSGGEIIDTAELREFETGAHRNSSAGKGDFSLIPPVGWHKVAVHFQNGAISKGRNNWKKGIPSTALLDSAIRHIIMYMQGDRKERHLIAAIWNLLCADYNEDFHADNPKIYDVEDFK
jgi:hypothetical protein